MRLIRGEPVLIRSNMSPLRSSIAWVRAATTGTPDERITSLEARVLQLENGKNALGNDPVPAPQPVRTRPDQSLSSVVFTHSVADPWTGVYQKQEEFMRKVEDAPVVTTEQLAALHELEKKVIWLSTYVVHNANNVRPSRDGLKVGGHQASSTSVATLLAALYFVELQPHDRVAVKPHASPIYHAIQYLLGNQSVEQLQQFRAFGGIPLRDSRPWTQGPGFGSFDLIWDFSMKGTQI